MYQPDLNTYLEAIRQQYETILQDNKQLQQENKKLLEINAEYKKKLLVYKSIYKSTSLIKLGSDWSVEGYKLYNMKLYTKILFDRITNSCISKNGTIIFISYNIVYIINNNIIYYINNDSILVYDEYIHKKNKIEYSHDYENIRSYTKFIIHDNILLVFNNNIMKKFDIEERVLLQTINMPNHLSMIVQDNYIYITCYDNTFRVYDNDKLIVLLNSTEEIKSNLVVINNIGYSVSSNMNIIMFDSINKTVTMNRLVHDDISEVQCFLYNISNTLVIRNNNKLIYYNTVSGSSSMHGDNMNGGGSMNGGDNMNGGGSMNGSMNGGGSMNGSSMNGSNSNVHSNSMHNSGTDVVHDGMHVTVHNSGTMCDNTVHTDNIIHNTTHSSNTIIKEVDIDDVVRYSCAVNNNILYGNNDSFVIYDYETDKKMYIKIKEFDIQKVYSTDKWILVEGNDAVRVYACE